MVGSGAGGGGARAEALDEGLEVFVPLVRFPEEVVVLFEPPPRVFTTFIPKMSSNGKRKI